MFASLLLFAAAPSIPAGAYAMPELCNRLYAVTGISHGTDVNLRDYPVFVSVKSGDPERIRTLVATAVHAVWLKDGERLRLVSTKVTPKEDFADFERQLKVATSNNPLFASIPSTDLYALSPGEPIRYSTTFGGVIRRMPPAMQRAMPQVEGEVAKFAMRRIGPGVFQTGPGDKEINFITLPEEIKQFLGANGSKQAMTPELEKKVEQIHLDPKSLQADFKDLGKKDPIATSSSPFLEAVAAVMDKDLVMALPDISLFAVSASSKSQTVESILGSYSMGLNWAVKDGALVGKLTNCELTTPAQVRRTVVGRFLSRIGEQGVANISILGEYMATQRVQASDSWMDVLMLVLSGTTIDQEFIIDHPFNVRLYASFSGADWSLLRSEKPFSVSELGPKAQKEVRNLLLFSRRAEDASKSDPAYWPSISPSALTMSAMLEEETVLIQKGVFGGGVSSVHETAANYEMRKKEIKREPVYQIAKRMKLQVSIFPTSGDPEVSGQPVETGFSEIQPDPKHVACEWQKLPAAMAKEFEEALKQFRDRDSGVPPPQR